MIKIQNVYESILIIMSLIHNWVSKKEKYILTILAPYNGSGLDLIKKQKKINQFNFPV